MVDVALARFRQVLSDFLELKAYSPLLGTLS